jgi:PilZ domain
MVRPMSFQNDNGQPMLAGAGNARGRKGRSVVIGQNDGLSLGLASRSETIPAVREIVAGERHRAQRFGIRAVLRYRAVGNGEWRQGIMVNISETGILFEGERVWGIGQAVELRFRLSTGNAGEPAVQVACRGKIVRSEIEITGTVVKAQAARINKFRFERPEPAGLV